MARDWLNAEIARQRQDELRRNAERKEWTADVVELRLRTTQLLGDSRRGWMALRAVARLSRGLLPR